MTIEIDWKVLFGDINDDAQVTPACGDEDQHVRGNQLSLSKSTIRDARCAIAPLPLTGQYGTRWVRISRKPPENASFSAALQ